MKFEWDERKRRINLTKHGVDFEIARQIFEARFVERDVAAPATANSA